MDTKKHVVQQREQQQLMRVACQIDAFSTFLCKLMPARFLPDTPTRDPIFYI
jgi:hypothetical protein